MRFQVCDGCGQRVFVLLPFRNQQNGTDMLCYDCAEEHEAQGAEVAENPFESLTTQDTWPMQNRMTDLD